MTAQPEIVPAEAKRRRRRGIRVRTIDEQHLTVRDIHPPDEFRQLVAHDVDVQGKTLDDDTLYLDFRVIAGPKQGENARMTIWAERSPWWLGFRPVLRVRVERNY